ALLEELGRRLRTVALPDPAQGRKLHPGDCRMIEQRRLAQRPQLLRLGSVIVLQLIDGDIERVQETAMTGRKGTAAGRVRQEERVERIDADEVGPVTGGDLAQLGQVFEVTDAPVALRA